MQYVCIIAVILLHHREIYSTPFKMLQNFSKWTLLSTWDRVLKMFCLVGTLNLAMKLFYVAKYE